MRTKQRFIEESLKWSKCFCLQTLQPGKFHCYLENYITKTENSRGIDNVTGSSGFSIFCLMLMKLATVIPSLFCLVLSWYFFLFFLVYYLYFFFFLSLCFFVGSWFLLHFLLLFLVFHIFFLFFLYFLLVILVINAYIHVCPRLCGVSYSIFSFK